MNNEDTCCIQFWIFSLANMIVYGKLARRYVMQERKYKTHQKYFNEDKETNEIIITNSSSLVNYNIEIPGKVIGTKY